MSSPATIAEMFDNAVPSNTLLIIPDGSTLWSTPKSDAQDETASPIHWQIDALKAFTDMLVNSTIGRNVPILVCAPSHTAYGLFNEQTEGHYPLVDWHRYALENDLRITIRFSLVECGRMILGSDKDNAAAVDMWFATDESFANRGNPIHCSSDDWSSVLRRLGFDASKWHSGWSVVQNVENGRVRNPISNAARPTSITVGTFVGMELATTSYEIG